MGSRYLTDLADVCRSLGLPTVEVGSSPSTTGDAWERRARGSGGYGEGRPTHLMLHHTASRSTASGWADANYCTFGAPARPLCNLLLSRQGDVFVCAAGASNTNGSGRDPCGVCPDDSMNTHAIGVEASNNGMGEVWSGVQLDNYVILVRGLCERYGIPFGRVHSHEEYAPLRKVDPAGPPRWVEPPGRAGTTIWNMDAFRADLVGFGGAGVPAPEPEPEPTPRSEEEPMYITAHSGHYWVGTQVWQRKLVRTDAEQLIARAKRDAAKGVVLLDFRSGKAVASIDDVGEISQNEGGDLGALVS